MRADGPPPEVRRRWGIVTVSFLLIAVVVLIAHRQMAGAVYDENVEDGLVALRAAMGGEADAYDEAIDQFRQAAVIGLIDGYPVFLLNAALRMKSCSSTDTMPNRAFFCALAETKCSEARAALSSFEAEKARGYARRLVEECDSVEKSVVK